MNNYFSDERIWFEPTAAIAALDDKELLIVKGENVDITQLQVETASPNSPERGKVCVVAWNVVVPNEPWEDVELIPTKPPKYFETGYWQRFLTRDAVNSIRPHTSGLLENVKIELTLADDGDSV